VLVRSSFGPRRAELQPWVPSPLVTGPCTMNVARARVPPLFPPALEPGGRGLELVTREPTRPTLPALPNFLSADYFRRPFPPYLQFRPGAAASPSDYVACSCPPPRRTPSYAKLR